MTKEYQGKQVSTGNMWNIPSRKDAYDLKVQIAMATETFTDEYGTEHEPVDSSWGWDDLEVQIGPSSQADVDTYTELIDSTTKIGGYNQSIMDIIVEESKSYFTGDKTVDEVADVIQNRVKTYVNENR
jgi:ABC-type glycerol-3-phosphate transport system substrate-binding protein